MGVGLACGNANVSTIVRVRGYSPHSHAHIVIFEDQHQQTNHKETAQRTKNIWRACVVPTLVSGSHHVASSGEPFLVFSSCRAVTWIPMGKIVCRYLRWGPINGFLGSICAGVCVCVCVCARRGVHQRANQAKPTQKVKRQNSTFSGEGNE